MPAIMNEIVILVYRKSTLVARLESAGPKERPILEAGLVVIRERLTQLGRQAAGR